MYHHLQSHIISNSSPHKYKSSEVRVVLVIKCCCIHVHIHFLLTRLQTVRTALLTICTHILATLASQERTVVSKNFRGSPQEGSSPAPPSRGQGQNVSRGGAHVSALKAEKQKEKCWKNKLLSQSNIQDVYRSRGFWTPWVDQSNVCLYSVKILIFFIIILTFLLKTGEVE